MKPYNFNNIVNLPNTKEFKTGYRKQISSKDENEFNKQVLSDIYNLYNIFNNLQVQSNDLFDAFIVENLYLKQELEKMKNINNGKVFRIPMNKVLEGKRECDLNTITNDLVPSNTYEVSKIKIKNKLSIGEDIIPKNIKMEITDNYEHDENVINISDNNLLNSLTAYNDIPFKRTILCKNYSEVESEFTITIPDGIVDDFNINEISIITFPIVGVYVKDIQYRLSNGSWNQVPSFIDHLKYEPGKGIEGNCRLNFKNITANEIKITLSCNKYIENDDKQSFTFGFKNIDIKYKELTTDLSTFTVPLELPVRDKKIKDVSVLYNNKSQIEYSNIAFEYYYIQDGEKRYIKSSLPFTVPSDKLFIKITIHNKNTFVNINSIKVEIE